MGIGIGLSEGPRQYGYSVRPVMNFSGITPAKQTDGTYQFTKPGYAVTVTAEFAAVVTGITTWSALQDAITNATEPTTIQLTQDLTASATGGASITIPEGKDITIDLNGHVINANSGAFSVIKVEEGGKLTLIDSKPETEHYFTVGDDGLWTMTDTKTETTKTVTGGVIAGGMGQVRDDRSDGGGIYVSGTLNMNGGNIVGNKAITGNGGGVYVNTDATFNMSGNSMIAGNTGYSGAGVNSNGTFKMSENSKLAYNKGSCGGGVLADGTFIMSGNSMIEYNEGALWAGGVQIANSGTFTMTENSKITYNKGQKGGGVYLVKGIFNMTGGSIDQNTATQNGGGVYVDNQDVTFNLGGTAKITGNKVGDAKTNNLYLSNGKLITLLDETNAPASGMKVGVTTQTAPTETAPVKITTNGASTDTKYFASDNDAYEVKHNTDYLKLAVKTTPYTPSEPTIVVPVSGGEEKVEVSATVSGEKATVGDISEKDIEKVVSGDKGDAVVEIDLSGLDKTISEVELPVKTVERIAEATQASGNKEAGMSVKMSAASVTFDAKATQAMVDQAEGNTIQLVVDDIKTVSLNAVQKEAVEKLATAIILDAYLVSNGIKLCTESKNGFAGGKATVALQYEIKNNRTPLNYKVFYVDDNGKLTNLKSKYNEETKSFVFDIEHFSNYAVAYDENGELQASKVNLTKTTTYKNGKIKLTFKRLKLSDGKKITSYQIYRSTSKKFNKNLKKYSISRTKNTKTYTWTNSKKLKKGTKYYYKVRGRVKLSDGTYAYTQWSKVKTAKCKKSR